MIGFVCEIGNMQGACVFLYRENCDLEKLEIERRNYETDFDEFPVTFKHYYIPNAMLGGQFRNKVQSYVH